MATKDTGGPAPGDVIRVKYPFLRCKVDVPEEGGYVTVDSWRPGVEHDTDNYGNSGPDICDAEGEMILTVVGVFKPGKFPARVFFTRQWKAPDGKEFGKGGCRVLSMQAFKRRAKGYAHQYEIEDRGTAS